MKKIKKHMIIVLTLTSLVLLIVILIGEKHFKGIMGNSSYNYYCEDSNFELREGKCIKEEVVDSLLLGDMNSDRLINVDDLYILSDYMKNSTYEWFADLNNDNLVDEADYTILNNYVNSNYSDVSVNAYSIGIKEFCPKNTNTQVYELVEDENKCKLTTVVDAKKGSAYIISYDGNGGTGHMADQSVNYDSNVEISKNTFVNNDYFFQGWKVYNQNQDKWMCYTDTLKNNYKFTTKDECDNNGYYLLKNGSTINKLASVGETVKLIAEWSQSNDYTITFDGNGASGKMDDQKVGYNFYSNINKNQFVSNVSFLGWFGYNNDKQQGYCYLDNNHINKGWVDQNSCDYGYYLFKDEEKIANLGSVGDNIKFVAQWNDKFTITYSGGGASGFMSDQTFTYGVATRMNKLNYTNNGSKFTGWMAHNLNTDKWFCYKKGRKEMAWMDQSQCTEGYYLYHDQHRLTDTGLPGETVNMIATWGNQFTITYSGGGASGSMKDQTFTYGVATRMNKLNYTNKGSKFTGWMAHNLSTNKWFCYKKGRKEKDWMNQSQCTEGYYLYHDQHALTNTGLPGETVNMIATWGNQYTITYSGGGASGSMKDQTFTYGVATRMNKLNYTKKGYAFAGWKAHNLSTNKWFCYKKGRKEKDWMDQSQCTEGYYLYHDQHALTNTGLPGETVNMIATWGNQYTITYSGGGASGSMPNQSFTYGIATRMNKLNYTKRGYAFAGWKAHNLSTNKWFCYKKGRKKLDWMNQSQCTEGYYLYHDQHALTNTGLPGQTVNMIATWTDKFTISYKNGDGTGSMADQSVTYGKKSQKLRKNTFKNKNKYFVGWKVHSVNTEQWRCYTNKAHTQASWTSKQACQNNGYQIFLDQADISTLSQPGNKINVTALWSKYEYATSNGKIYPIKNYNIVGTKKGLSNYFNFGAGNVSQCPWYVKYRAIEIVMTSSLNSKDQEKAKKALSNTSGNGNKWYGGASNSLKYFKYTNNVNKPQSGSIVSWEMNAHNYGHVGIVEKVYNDGSILLSEGWNRYGENGSNGVKSIKIVTRKMSKSAIKTYNGKGRFKGYTYLFQPAG